MSYPTSIWTGVSDNRTANQEKSPDWRDWNRMIEEVSAAQARVNANQAARDVDTLDAVGTINTTTGLSLLEKGDGAIHKTVFTFDGVEIASTDGTDAPNDGAWGTLKLYTFPIGRLVRYGAHLTFPAGNLVATSALGFTETSDFEIGVGFVATAQAVGFGLGDGTQEDIVEAIVCKLTTGFKSNAIESVADIGAAVFDGTTSAGTINLNFRTLNDADHDGLADVLTVTGTLTVLWTCLGDD